MDKSSKITVTIVGALWAALFLWLGLWKFNIPFNFGSFGAFLYYGILVVGMPVTTWIFAFSADMYGEPSGITYVPAALLVIVAIVGGAISSPLFNANAYASQISIPEPTPFGESDIAPFDPTQIPWVSEEYAGVLGDKLIGTLGAVGSSVELGEFVRQDVAGELFFVAPILHSGFWKYNANPGGTAGYIMVSMTDDNDVRLVEDFKIRVQPSGHAAWGDKLERIVQGAVPSGLRYEYKFEVDDELHPWWVVPIYENQVGLWGGKEIVKVVLVDATNGNNVHVYGVDNVPEWVDRIYPSGLIESQLENWGLYSRGFWNTLFGKTGLLQSDEGNVVVYSGDDCYVFDSLTSYAGADESTVGFVLTNTRTKEVEYFSLAGATEWAACQSALGDERVKAQNYAAVFPIPTMIEGQPTYFIPLSDPNSGIIKTFALVNIEKYQTVGIGTTIREVERDYRAKLRESGAASLYTPSADLLEITGKVLRWGAYTEGGNTYYLFVIEGHEEVLLLTDTSAAEAAITREGDRVKLEVIATENSGWTVFSFDNLEFEQTLSEVEEAVTADEYQQRLKEVQDDPAIMDDSKFQEFWNLLTPEQQEEFLQQAQ